MTGDAWDRFVNDIRENGQDEPIKYFIEKGQKVGLDGRHRERACLELGIKPKYQKVSRPERAEAKIDSANLYRRHLTAEERQSRVEELRAEGQSTREIAGKLGVSQGTVVGDLKKSASESQNSREEQGSGDQNYSPEATFSVENEGSDEKILGRDGRQYPATRKRRFQGSKPPDEP
jgi:transposase